MMRPLCLLFLLAINPISVVKADPLLLETDGLIDVYGGTSLNLLHSGKFMDKLSMGAGLMEITIPESMYDEYPDAKGKDWRVHLTGGRLICDYHFSGVESGATLGLHLAYDYYQVRRLGHSSKFRQLGQALRFGYVWRPWDNHWYLMPIAYLLNSHKVSGSNSVLGEKFDADFLGIQAAISLGYRFQD